MIYPIVPSSSFRPRLVARVDALAASASPHVFYAVASGAITAYTPHSYVGLVETTMALPKTEVRNFAMPITAATRPDLSRLVDVLRRYFERRLSLLTPAVSIAALLSYATYITEVQQRSTLPDTPISVWLEISSYATLGTSIAKGWRLSQSGTEPTQGVTDHQDALRLSVIERFRGKMPPDTFKLFAKLAGSERLKDSESIEKVFYRS